jgi:hypothetical protein
MEITGTFAAINKWLATRWTTPGGEPLFKLIWSDNEREMRFGTFRDFSPEGIYLREVTEMRSVLKYNYLKERWILESWCPPEVVFSPELPKSIYGSYEPVWVFESKDGQYQAPTLRVVEFLVNFLMNKEKVTPMTRRAQLRDEVVAREDQEVADFMEQLEIPTAMESRLHSGEGVGYTKGLRDA